MGLFKDITTTKDGESFDVVRVAMTAVILMLPPIMVWGILMQTLLAFGVIKAFDMQGSFQAILAFLVGFGAFLMSGSASLLFKKSTEPNGAVTETESITKGKQPDNIQNTTIVS